jgi:hypothetical protein
MPILTPSFLFRINYPCLFIPGFPHQQGDDLLALPNATLLPDSIRLAEKPGFSEIRLGWNDQGIGIDLRVRGKDLPVRGDAAKYRSSDGISLWLDSRNARESHRASRYCHHFFFLAWGGGSEGDEPVAGQTKIHRALADAPLCRPDQLQVRKHALKGGYRLECLISADAIHGFDVDLNNKFGFFYAVRDGELGEQTLCLGPEFPYAEDPSLWQILELQRK